ncbi:MAG: DsrE family protein [Proteobacteria bacterium]|nr:DsrE family protein [Pseudomonadota bacterium]
MGQARGQLRRTLGRLIALLLLVGAANLAAAADVGQVKVVYHLNQGLEQATAALRNIRNHLSADPKAKIVVVAHAAGIDFLLEGARDRNGNPYDALVQEFADKGVAFRVCNFTLVTRNIDKSRVIPEASIVPSGVAEVARLQAQEGYAYIRP